MIILFICSALVRVRVRDFVFLYVYELFYFILYEMIRCCLCLYLSLVLFSVRFALSPFTFIALPDQIHLVIAIKSHHI